MLAEDGNVDLAATVDTDDVGLNESGVLGRGHIPEKHGFAVLASDRDVFHAIYQLVHGVGIEGVVHVADFSVAGRQEDIVFVDGVHQIERRQIARLHFVTIHVGHDRPHLAPINHRGNRAGHRHNHVADLITTRVVEDRFLFVLAVESH